MNLKLIFLKNSFILNLQIIYYAINNKKMIKNLNIYIYVVIFFYIKY